MPIISWWIPGWISSPARAGLKQYSGWRGSILTDSGGYQAFSLAARRSLKQEGVEFTDHLHGNRHLFSPEFTLSAQLRIGVDFTMPI